MKSKLSLLMFMSILVLFACNSSMLKKQLKVPEMFQIGNRQKKLQIEKDKALLVYINGDCYHCILELNEWDSLLQNTNIQQNCQISFFTDAYDTTQYKEMKNRFTHFSYPVYYDYKQKFWFTNKLNMTIKSKTYYIENRNLIYQGDYLNDRRYRVKVNNRIE